MSEQWWNWQLFRWTMLITAVLLTRAMSSYAGAGIATDGSVGARQTIAGANAGPGNFAIPQALGSLAGNNLFHSFSKFNIDTGQTATFTTSTASIANVISRVTGGSNSQINGMLQLLPTAGSAPAFFFINPAGVVFGAGAVISVPGAFHVSTADYLRFVNGDKYYANLRQASTLSSAAPAAFGFLGTGRASITVSDGARLQTRLSQPISIVGGDIEIKSGELSAQGGDIRVVALGQATHEVAFNGALPAASGTLQVLNGGTIVSDSAGAIDGGPIAVSAGGITIDGGGDHFAAIFGRAMPGTGKGGRVEVSTTGDLVLANGGIIGSSAFSTGDAGSVIVSAGSIAIDGKGSAVTGIVSQARSGLGKVGSIEVTVAGSLSLINGGQIASGAFSAGNAGPVKVRAGSIAIDKGSGSVTGIFSRAISGTGHAGNVEVSTNGELSIVNGGTIDSDTYSSAHAGTVKVSAGSIAIDDKRSDSLTGIFSRAMPGSTGDAGSVEVSTNGELSIVNGSTIVSDTYSSGNAGTVKVSAGSISIDDKRSDSLTGIFSRAMPGSTGDAGSVAVSTNGELSIVNGGLITSDTYSSGNAGTVKVKAGSVAIEHQGGGITTGIFSRSVGGPGNGGNIEISTNGDLSIVKGGSISSDTYSSGNAGTVKVSAGSVTINGQGSGHLTGIFSRARAGTGNAGSVEISVRDALSLVNGGVIDSSTYSAGDAGKVKVSAGSIAIDGQQSFSATGIFSRSARGSSGNAGDVEVSATGDFSVVNGGAVSTSTRAAGHAGTVTVRAGSVAINGLGYPTGISSEAEPGSTGSAGSVEVSATGTLSIVNAGKISSSTFSAGNAGTVTVRAGSIAIDGQGTRFETGILSQANSDSTGNAGSVEVSAAGNLSLLRGGEIASSTYSVGNAGRVDVAATGELSLVNGGRILSSTFSAGHASTVTVSAGRVTIDGQKNHSATGIASTAERGSSGNAGRVDFSATGALSIVNGGSISTSTSSAGNAGTVSVSAGSIAIDAQQSSNATGIFSMTNGSTGNAGSLAVTASEDLGIVHGGAISSATFSSGKAGAVTVRAASLRVDGVSSVDGSSSQISASAQGGSSGQTGTVEVTANDITLSNGGAISIENLASVANPSTLTPTSITVAAPRITMVNSPDAITTKSTGNVAAGSIRVSADDQLHLDPSGISTTANEGSGGAIEITAGLLRLDGSRITTSVTSARNGNGGNISVAAESLVLNTGFIQANTAAANASGGLVSISVQNLVASGNTLFLGGNTIHGFRPDIFGFNVIQAAAPTGVSGTLQISTPALDISGSLVGLDTRLIRGDQLVRSLCEYSSDSSLIPVGRGGLPLGGSDFLSPGQIFGLGRVTLPMPGLVPRQSETPAGRSGSVRRTPC